LPRSGGRKVTGDWRGRERVGLQLASTGFMKASLNQENDRNPGVDICCVTVGVLTLDIEIAEGLLLLFGEGKPLDPAKRT